MSDRNTPAPSPRVFEVRPLVTANLPELFRVQAQSFAPEYRESEAALLSRMALFRAGALDLDRLSLVAVQGSEAFWQRSGFAPVATLEYVPGSPATRMEAGAAAVRALLSNISNSRNTTE
jgi:hypothetical protein